VAKSCAIRRSTALSQKPNGREVLSEVLSAVVFMVILRVCGAPTTDVIRHINVTVHVHAV